MVNDGFKRQTAVKIKVQDIKESRYIKANGDWEPNYILTPYNTKASRVNVIGSVISESEGNSFSIDDGSGQITVRSFEELNYPPKMGEVILLVGRPREFSEEIYIVPEIIKAIEKNKEAWAELRKLELEKLYKGLKREVPSETPVINEENIPGIEENAKEEKIESNTKEPIEEENTNKENTKNTFDLVIKTIKEIDTGEGADMEEIIEKTGIDEKEVENIINNLLMDGEAFEIRPGKLKLLD
ncbi:MAG: hypothetical protein ACQESF_00055 [Nanobdellota archaeon]